MYDGLWLYWKIYDLKYFIKINTHIDIINMNDNIGGDLNVDPICIIWYKI